MCGSRIGQENVRKKLQKAQPPWRMLWSTFTSKGHPTSFLANIPREEDSPGGYSVHSPSPSDLLLNYLFIPLIPDSTAKRNKPTEPSHFGHLGEWKMKKEEMGNQKRNSVQGLYFYEMVLTCLSHSFRMLPRALKVRNHKYQLQSSSYESKRTPNCCKTLL